MTQKEEHKRTMFIALARLRAAVATGALSAALVFSLATLSLAKEPVGGTVPLQVESPHPYADGDSSLPVMWTHTIHHPGATFLKIHFAQFALGPGDSLSLRDNHDQVVASYTAEWNARSSFWALAAAGDSLTLELRADADGADVGIIIDRYGYGGGILVLESLCSSADRKEDVACYAGTSLATASRAVGRMLFEERGVFYACTGFLVSSQDHFMSNEHCISSQAAVDSLEVTFDYERTSCGGSGFSLGETFIGDKLILTNAKLDVALMTLQGQPSAQYGFLTLSDREPFADELLSLPQHPGGNFKQVSVAGCQVSTPMRDGYAEDSDLGHLCDTENGSSGSPVLDQEDNVIGLHHLGGCTGSGGENQAVLMNRILPLLPPLAHDLALGKIVAPRSVVLTADQPKTVVVKVQLWNRSALEEIIPDRETLEDLVQLTVESLGSCPSPVSSLRANALTKAFPLTLQPGKKLDVGFEVTFSCVNSAAAPDYRYRAVVDYTVLGGVTDAHPENDYCPRDATPAAAFGRKWRDSGCGAKKPDHTWGADVLTEVRVGGATH